MFEGLSGGASFELADDHDPVSLREHFYALALENFEWQYLEQGPQIWRIQISKKPTAKKEAGCCGICNGGQH